MVPVNEPLLGAYEKEFLNQCIDTGWISSEGPFVEEFEKRFANLVGRKYAIAVANGTAALEIAVSALGLGPGDEVILPAFTIISCAAAVVKNGATPVLVDSDPYTWNMDVNQIEDKITPRTKAIMAVHTYGLPVDMKPVLELAKKYDLYIIEDAAEMIGQQYKGQECGSFGDISTFSFYPNKHITTGEGGMVVTDNYDLTKECRSLRNLCFQGSRRFVHEKLGWNYRLTNLQAAVGLAQLERLEESVVKKRKIGNIYQSRLSDIPSIRLPLPSTEYAENIYWVFGIVLDRQAIHDAADIMQCLKRRKIGTRPFFWPMHEQPVFQKMGFFRDEHYPVSEEIARLGFYLPSGLTLNVDQIEYVSQILHEVLK